MPKPIKKEILKALNEYQQRIADILTKQGVKAHVVGDLKAYKKLAPITIDFGSVQRGAKEFGMKYGALLRKDGATMIHGKKVAWLAESLKETRSKVSDIITEGVRTGKGTDTIARELRSTLIRDKNYEYKRIARTETGNIQAHAADKRYKEEGVEEVDWLCGQKPCAICGQYCGKRYKIDEAPALLVHPNCTCDKAPVVTRKVRETIDIKAMDDKEMATQLWKKTARDGNEHAIIRNGIPIFIGGSSKHVNIGANVPKTPFALSHSHPKWDSPLSGGDIHFFLYNQNNTEMVAASETHIYKAIRMPKTITFKSMSEEAAFNENFSKMANSELQKIHIAEPFKKYTDAWREANIKIGEEMAKKFKFKYEVIPR